MRIDEVLSEVSRRDFLKGMGSLGAGVLPKLPDIEKELPSPPPPKKIDPIHQKMASKIVDKYGIDDKLATKVVDLAHKHEKSGFPTAKDILAIIGIESSFNPNAVSRLQTDPAVGLMQVRPAVWNMNPSDLKDIEKQIEVGSDILHQYYQKLRNKNATLSAYNVGLTRYLNGERPQNYLNKYHQELKMYSGI
jgi:hypothetical protein